MNSNPQNVDARRTVLFLFLAAVSVRVLLFVMFSDELFVGSDQVEYIRHARNFASGDLGGLLDTYWPPFFPFVLGLAYLFSTDLVLPSVAVAVLFGSLAVPLIYYFVRQSYGHREGLIAGVLAVFYPHLLNSVFDLGSENVYLVLIVLCLFTGWKAIISDSLLNYALAGGLVGLAYLTRPEAFAYSAFFIGVILFRNIWKKEQFIKRSLIYGGTFLIAFLVFATPYLVYLKGEMGRWTISSKTEINTVMGDYTNPAAADGDSLTNPTLSLRTGADLLRSFSFNMVAINKSLPYLIPLGGMIFIALGLFATDWTSTRAKREAYLISFCLLTIVGYAAAVVQTRYFYILLPVVFGWMAKGIFAFNSWFQATVKNLGAWERVRTASRYIPAICIASMFLYLLPLNFFVGSREATWHERPYEERDAGEWLRQNARPMTTVFSARKAPAFYAGATQVTPKTTDLDEVFSEIKTTGVEYVVAGTRGLKRNPYLQGLEERLQGDSDFERVYSHADHPDYKISIYKRK